MNQELPEGTVTVLFTDIEGFTDLGSRAGDDAAHEVARAHGDVLRRQIAKYGGREIKALGDGFMVGFASARRAVECAVAIQRALHRWNRQHPEEPALVRMGLNTGEVIQDEGDLFGSAVNAASRIAGAARGGQIYAADVVKQLAGMVPDVTLTDAGTFELKGFPEPWHLWEIVWKEDAPVLLMTERTPFVGREEERAQLRALLEGAASGQGGAVFVAGEPGVGKSRLAQELAVEAERREMLTFTGRCYETEGAPPYIPFVEIVEAATRSISPDTLRGVLGDSAPEVARLVPRITRMFPDIPPPLDLPPEQERRYIFNSLSEFLARAGELVPMLLVIEDLHWADGSTLLLGQHLAQTLPKLPILIVGTYRDTPGERNPELVRVLEELHRMRLAHILTLKPLPHSAIEQMMRALTGAPPPQALVGKIYAETEGNPFFVEEILKHLVEEGEVLDEAGRWREDLDERDVQIPEGLRLVIGRRLDRLSETGRKALAAAALIGRAFSFALLEELTEIPTDDLLDVVEDAERAGLVASLPDRDEAKFTFPHELIRQALIGELSTARRQRLHLKIVEAYEKLYAPAGETNAAELAHHLTQAGRMAPTDKTRVYLALAGDRAVEAAAFEEALRHYERALGSVDAAGGEARADLLAKIGGVQRSLGRFDTALETWGEAIDLYESLGRPEEVARLCDDSAYLQAWSARWLEGMMLTQRALSLLQERSSLRARLLGFGGVMLSMGGSYDGGLEMIEESIAMAEELGDKRELGNTLFAKALHHFSYLELGRSIEAGLDSADLLRGAGALWDLVNPLTWTSFALLFHGRIEEAIGLADEAAGLSEKLGHVGGGLLARRAYMFLDGITTADLDRGEAAAREDLETCIKAALPWVSQSHVWIGGNEFYRGRWTEARASFEAGRDAEVPSVWAHVAESFVLLLDGEEQRDEQVRQTVIAWRSELPTGGPRPIGDWMRILAMSEALAEIGDYEAAAELYPELARLLESSGAMMRFMDGVLLQRNLAMAAIGLDLDLAARHFAIATRQADELPHPAEAAYVRYWEGRTLVERAAGDDAARGADLLGDARRRFADLGMPKHVEAAQRAGARV